MRHCFRDTRLPVMLRITPKPGQLRSRILPSKTGRCRPSHLIQKMSYRKRYPLPRILSPNLKTVRLLMTKVTALFPFAPTGNLNITNNSPTMSVSMPNLISTYGSFIIGGFAELSIPSLELVNGSLMLTNVNLPSISAPNLTKVNGDLYVTGNFTRYGSIELTPSRYRLIRITVFSSQLWAA